MQCRKTALSTYVYCENNSIKKTNIFVYTYFFGKLRNKLNICNGPHAISHLFSVFIKYTH